MYALTVALLTFSLTVTTAQDFKPGDAVRVGKKDAAVYGATNYLYYVRLREYIEAGDLDGALEMVEKKTAVKVNGGVEGKVIKSRSNYAEVRILEGPHKGRAYFFPVEVVTR